MEPLKEISKNNHEEDKERKARELKILTKINLNLDDTSHDVNINETTQGFVTQVNSPEPDDRDKLSPIIDNSKATFNLISSSNNVTSTDEKRKSNNKNQQPNELKLIKQLQSKDYDFVIPALKSQTNSFISAHQNLMTLKDESKKSFDFFPEIKAEKAKYNTNNVFSKKVYVNFLTKKVQSELRMKKRESIKNKILIHDNKPIKSAKLSKLNNSLNYELSANEIVNQSEESKDSANMPKPSLIMPIKPSFKIKITNKTKSSDNLLNINKSRRGKTKSSTAIREESKIRAPSRHTENPRVKPGRKIIDLNVLSDDSVLASHYLNQPVRKFGDLKLNENWPSSNMYKVTIQTNPWVKSFKEKIIVNEFNSNYRQLSSDDLKKNSNIFDYLSSRPDTKQPQNFFPNIKQVFS